MLKVGNFEEEMKTVWQII